MVVDPSMVEVMFDMLGVLTVQDVSPRLVIFMCVQE